MLTENTDFIYKQFCCQWYESPFVDEDGNRFRNAEAYFMYRKAKLFKDDEIAAQILSLNQHPKLVKELGRQVFFSLT